MTKNERPGELVLENRHLLLAFFAVVALCGVFFALGYIVGRNTFSSSSSSAIPTETTVAAASAKPSPMPPALYLNRKPQENIAGEPASGTDLSFYQSVEQNPEAKLTPPESSAPPAPAEPTPPAPALEAQASKEPVSQPLPAEFLVQVSALSRREDADTLVQLLKERKLPVLVTAGTNDPFFHVMVGPYQNEDEAQNVKKLLEDDGFRPFLKR